VKKLLKWIGLVILVFFVAMIFVGPKSDGKFSNTVNLEEKFITSNPLDVSQISSISKFRSCVGHDYSGYNTEGERERLRTMKHYLTPALGFENTSGKLKVFAPFDGTIRSIEGDAGPENRQRGWQVWLKPEGISGWNFVFFHIDLLGMLEEGSEVTAGDLIGHGNVEGAANFDMIVKANNGVKGPNIIDSPFLHMTPEVLVEYVDVGLTQENVVLSKEYRDANDCPIEPGTESKNDTVFKSFGNDFEEWVVIN